MTKKEGKGTFISADGLKYEGDWKDDKKMEKEFNIGLKVTNMMEIGLTTKKKEKGFLFWLIT